MFVLTPRYEVKVPAGLLPDGSHASTSISLSSSADWYVLTTKHNFPEGPVMQTTLVMWSQALRSLLEQLTNASVVELTWMHPERRTGRWSIRTVREVWLPPKGAEDRLGALLFKVEGVDGFLDDDAVPVGPLTGGGQRRLWAVTH